MGFDWNTSEMSILMVAKLAVGTARIVINSLHLKGDVCKIISFAFMLASMICNRDFSIIEDELAVLEKKKNRRLGWLL